MLYVCGFKNIRNNKQILSKSEAQKENLEPVRES